MTLDFSIIFKKDILLLLLKAYGWTLGITAMALTLGIVIGTILSSFPSIGGMLTIYPSFVFNDNTPSIVDVTDDMQHSDFTNTFPPPLGTVSVDMESWHVSCFMYALYVLDFPSQYVTVKVSL